MSRDSTRGVTFFINYFPSLRFKPKDFKLNPLKDNWAKIEFMANPAPKKCTWKIMDENESRNNSKSCNISTIIEGRYYVNLSWTVKYTSILLEVNNELGTSEFIPDFNHGNIIEVLPTSQDVLSGSLIR